MPGYRRGTDVSPPAESGVADGRPRGRRYGAAASCAFAALVGAGAILAPAAQATAPPAGVGCGLTTTHYPGDGAAVPIPTGPATVTRTMTVVGAGTKIADIDLKTNITHTFAADLDITLTSPAGTVVTLTTDNGTSNDNVFDGTVWDDDAGDTNPPGAVTDATYVNLVAQPTLVPEEAMAAFNDEDPNGTWTLTANDDLAGEGGSIDALDLAVTTYSPTPRMTATATTPGTGGVPIPDVSTVTSTATVSGAGAQLTKVVVHTNITHTFANDLDITLTSPAGTVVTLTTDNGGNNDNVFAGTTWDDDAGDTNPPGPVTDTTFANLVVATPLVPEEAMGAFIGEDPNGTWTLTIIDDLGGDTGTLVSWDVATTTGTCAPTYVPCDPTLTPAGCWAFSEPSGTTAFDASGNVNNGTYLNGPTLGVPGALAGPPNTAVRLDGINDTIRVPDSNSLDVGNSFTAEGWIKRSSDAKSHEFMNKGFQVVVMNAANGNQIWLRKPNVTTIAKSSGGVGAGAYHHVVVTKDGSGVGAVKFYIDGAPVPAIDVAPVQVIQDTSSFLVFGGAGTTPADYDEFAIYDGVLTPAQILARYNAALGI